MRIIASEHMHLLIVEDHADTASIMGRLLALDGHTVDIARTARSAEDLCARNEYDVLIVDIGLPDASGWDLMRSLLQRCPVRAIVLSGYGCAEDIERSREAGFALHLTKPVEINQLRAAVKSVGASAPRNAPVLPESATPASPSP
jgi:DNA-binding response OmpR family regulator